MDKPPSPTPRKKRDRSSDKDAEISLQSIAELLHNANVSSRAPSLQRDALWDCTTNISRTLILMQGENQ